MEELSDSHWRASDICSKEIRSELQLAVEGVADLVPCYVADGGLFEFGRMRFLSSWLTPTPSRVIYIALRGHGRDFAAADRRLYSHRHNERILHPGGVAFSPVAVGEPFLVMGCYCAVGRHVVVVFLCCGLAVGLRKRAGFG